MIVSINNNSNRLNIKKLAIDTNILLWTFYGNITYVQTYQKNIYPSFLSDKIGTKKCKIYTTIYNICELFNVIEKNEYELYLENNSLTKENFSKKQYREIIEERERIKEIFNLLYNQISNCIEILEYQIDINFIKEYNESYIEHKYDIFDFALLKFCKDNNINYVLTDDSDFGSYQDFTKDMKILTANRKFER